MSDKLGVRTTRALKWNILGTMGRVLLQVGIMAVLARLIGPKEYGLLAIALVFNKFTKFFAEMGLGPSIIQNDNLDNDDIRSCFTLAIILGLLAAIITVLIAPLAVVIFHNERVVELIRVLALSFIFTSFSVTALNLMRRELSFKKVAIVETVAYLVGNGTVSIVFAYLGFGVWSLIFGILAQQFLLGVLSFLSRRHPVKPIFTNSAIKRNLRFGAHYTVNSLIDFFHANLVAIILGNKFAEEIVGLFNRAVRLANLPSEYFSTSIMQVMFPSLSRQQNDREKLKRSFLQTFILTGVFSGGISFAMIPATREIIFVVLGEDWLEAIIPFKLLCIYVPIQFCLSLQGITFVSVGKLWTKTAASIASVAIRAAILYVSAVRFGFHGFLAAITVTFILQQIIYLPFLKRRLFIPIKSLLSRYLYIAGNCAVIGGIVFGITEMLNMIGLPQIVVLIAQIAVGFFTLVSLVIFLMLKSPFKVEKDVLFKLPMIGPLLRKLKIV